MSDEIGKDIHLLQKAMDMCKDAHDSINQRQKYSLDPYWIHPFRVMALLSTCTQNIEIKCAALLHDVIEDVYPSNPKFSLEFIEKEFGHNISLFVKELTDTTTLSMGNRKVRKALDRDRLRTISVSSRMIKIADNIDNLCSIKKHDPKFYVVVKEEMILGFPILVELGVKTAQGETFAPLADVLYSLLFSKEEKY